MWKSLILHRNQKNFLSSLVYKHLKGIFVGAFFKKRPVQRMTEEIHSITNRGRMAKIECENDDLTLTEVYTVYVKN